MRTRSEGIRKAAARAGAAPGRGASLGGRAFVGMAICALTFAALATPADAQRRSRHYDRADKPRAYLGGAINFADPVGEFAHFVNDGWGGNLYVRVPVDPAGILSLRLDGGFIQYGHERQSVCLSLTVGCRIITDLVTTNNILHLDAGPELGLDLGPIRPYAGISAGLAYFETSSSLQDFDDYEYDYDVFETTNFDDLVLAWRARTGLQVRLSRGRNPVYLDLGSVYHMNGEAEYLREGDIEDNADGSVTVYPTFSEANLVTFQFGVSVGLGGSRDRGWDEHDDRWDRRPRRRRR